MYLLDTNALSGSLFNPDFLSETARKVIETDNDLYVSIASLWEISIKQSIGKLKIDALGKRDSPQFPLCEKRDCPFSLKSRLKNQKSGSKIEFWKDMDFLHFIRIMI